MRPHIFITTSAVHSSYANTTLFKDTARSAWTSGVADNTLKVKTNWYASNKHRITAGASVTHHAITPGNSGYAHTSISNMNLLESALFANHNIDYNNWQVAYGLRGVAYQNIGKATWHEYAHDYEQYKTHSESKGTWCTYNSLEPRVLVSYRIGKQEVSASYTRTSQAMQMLTNTNLAYSAIETWVSSSPQIAPTISNNAAVAYSFTHNSYSLSTEVYARNIRNQIDYIDNVQLYGNPYIESQIRKGKAQAYGVECNAQRNGERNTLIMSYSYARVHYIIPEIMQEKYRAPYDMPHDIKLQMNQTIKKRLSCNALWVFSSGRPGTFPIGFFYTEKKNTTNAKRIPVYSTRNADSYPNYHRLDLSFTLQGKTRKHIEQSITAGVYNIYGRKNPLYYNFDYYSVMHRKNMIEATYFPTFLPNFTYKATIK